MNKTTKIASSRIKKLTQQLEVLQERQAKLVMDTETSMTVVVKKNKAHFKRVRANKDTASVLGSYLLYVSITAKTNEIFVPLSIASGKKTAGFMYYIEGTAPSSVASAEVEVGGEGVLVVTIGTIRYVKIPPGKSATFVLKVVVRGRYGEVYKIIISKIHYKLFLHEVRYRLFEKTLPSVLLKFA